MHVAAAQIALMAAAVLLPTATRAAEPAPPQVAVEPVTSHKLDHVPGKSITVVRVKFPPGSRSQAHRHAGAVTVFVLSGSIRSQIDDGPLTTYKAGDTFFEPLASCIPRPKMPAPRSRQKPSPSSLPTRARP